MGTTKTVLLAHLAISKIYLVDVQSLINEIVEPYESWIRENNYPANCYVIKNSQREYHDLSSEVEIYLEFNAPDIAAHFIMKHAGEIPIYESWGTPKRQVLSQYLSGD